MPFHNNPSSRVTADRICCVLAAVVTAVAGGSALAQSSESRAEAFVQPYKTVRIPATEVGTLTGFNVAEGDMVTHGQIVARLDDAILQAALAAARSAKDAKGNERAAKAELLMKERQLKSLEELRGRGNATQRELDRALADRELSEARLQTVREELEVRRFEHERILAQIEKRILRSPISGVVSEIVKEAGEFVAPTDPVVMTVVQLDPVKAEFSLAIEASKTVNVGDRVPLTVGISETPIEGFVEFKAPTADPKSGTVRVKVRIPNREGQILSGSTCQWDIEGAAADAFAGRPSRSLIMAKHPSRSIR